MNPTNPDIRKGGIYAFISPQFGSWSAYDPSGHLLNQGMITLKANIVQAEKAARPYSGWKETPSHTVYLPAPTRREKPCNPT
ncbi:hypothetical protein ACFOPQ_15425 [Deinococcus antarcticus]|uniref:Uncharacterized protein n=1 Tax=Deinococcus antarcticus TaxID=1298767 RepID=A0ABV8AD57_9DEIO